ncbi:cytochrome P450 [Daedaleopsis nitida]|nr:cytochrome P450 [Daedaleopsis nitida]
MNSNGVIKFRTVQELHARRYLLRLLDSPGDFLHHGRHLFGSSIIRVGYGIDVDKSDVDYLGIAEEAMNKFNLTFLPGKFLVDSFPSMRHIPSFLPGGGFKRWAARWYPTVRRMRDVPWDAAVNAARKGDCLPSMATGLLERLSHLDDPVAVAEEEEYSKNAIASAYAGGADTTLSTLQSFYLAMATYPEIQQRAQAELDTVVGPHRLPTFADAPELPYISALVKECLRWRPVVPLSLVHLSVAEDEYRGYRIPAGTAVVSNPWAYARDPNLYPNPEAFMPERFLKDGRLNPDIVDPNTIVFGFGRRICPGRYFAEAAIFIAVSSVLHSFSISPPLDETGKPVNLVATVKMSYGVISYPEPFDCVIKPRSTATETLIRMSCTEDVEEA